MLICGTNDLFKKTTFTTEFKPLEFRKYHIRIGLNKKDSKLLAYFIQVKLIKKKRKNIW